MAALHEPLLEKHSGNDDHVRFFFPPSFRLSVPDWSSDEGGFNNGSPCGEHGGNSAVEEEDEEFNMAAEELIEEALKNQFEDPARFVSNQMPSRQAGNIGRSQSTCHRRSTFLLKRQTSRRDRYLRTRSVCTSGEYLDLDVGSVDLIPSSQEEIDAGEVCVGEDSDSEEDDDDMLQRIKSAPYPMSKKRAARRAARKARTVTKSELNRSPPSIDISNTMLNSESIRIDSSRSIPRVFVQPPDVDSVYQLSTNESDDDDLLTVEEALAMDLLDGVVDGADDVATPPSESTEPRDEVLETKTEEEVPEEKDRQPINNNLDAGFDQQQTSTKTNILAPIQIEEKSRGSRHRRKDWRQWMDKMRNAAKTPEEIRRANYCEIWNYWKRAEATRSSIDAVENKQDGVVAISKGMKRHRACYTMRDAKLVGILMGMALSNELSEHSEKFMGGGWRFTPGLAVSANHWQFDDFEKMPSPSGQKTCWSKRCLVPEACGCYHRKLDDMSSVNSKRVDRDEMLRHKRQKGVHTDRPSWSSKWKRDLRTMQDKAGSTFSNVYFWNNTVYDIEGHYGPAVASVFVFIQWLMFLNLLMLLLVVVFIVIPHVTVLNSIPKNSSLPSYDYQVLSCDSNGSNTFDGGDSEDSAVGKELFMDDIQDFLQGTGWMEWTEMFYGFYSYSYNTSTQVYSNATIIGTIGFKYNLPLAYLFVTFTYFIVCFVLMMREVARGTREILFTTTGKLNECCTAVFSGWDFCVRKEKKAFIRHEMVHNELMAILEDVKQEMERRNRTSKERMKLYTIRFLVNVVVIFSLMLCGYFIYFAFTISQHLLTTQMGRFQTLTAQFLPPITITALNAIVPLIFEKCTKLEKYPPERVINMLLLRVVFLRLASIAVLIVTLYKTVYGETSNNLSKDHCTLQCWETYVGQQIYKLALMDFGIGTLITFVIQLPRKYLVTRFDFFLTRWIGLPTFDIPAHVLDVVYSQSLCWMGTFYCPLLPVLNVVKFFVFFYVKQFALFVNCSQSCTNYRASKSKNLFILMLLFSFVLAIIPVAFSIGQTTPSTACGPFMNLPSMWETVPNTMSTWPTTAQLFFSYFGTAGFTIPAVIALSLIIYYYAIVSSANKHEITLLQNQLLMEGQDKQFLLKKLKEVMAALGHD